MGCFAFQSSWGRYRAQRDWRGEKGNWERLKEFGSSMEEHERTCKTGVGRGQIGVRVCVRAGWGWDDNMLSGNEREREPDGFGEESHTERSKRGERTGVRLDVPLSYPLPSLQVASLAHPLFFFCSPQTWQSLQKRQHCFAFASFPNSWHMLLSDMWKTLVS